MSDPKDRPSDEHAPELAAAAHGAHGHDEHGHDEEPLGPPDIGLWSAGIGGIAVAIVIAACFAFSTGAL
jgi:hypothetical protein